MRLVFLACKSCDIPKPRIPSDKQWRYHDGQGLWHGRTCYACTQVSKRRDKFARIATYAPCQRKGIQAEQIAAAAFRARGFDVLPAASRGPDLRLLAQGRVLTVEVKSAVKEPSANSWYVAAVSPARRGDDFIAIVLPNNSLHVEAMAEHLRQCAPAGTRRVTDLVMEVAQCA